MADQLAAFLLRTEAAGALRTWQDSPRKKAAVCVACVAAAAGMRYALHRTTAPGADELRRRRVALESHLRQLLPAADSCSDPLTRVDFVTGRQLWIKARAAGCDAALVRKLAALLRDNIRARLRAACEAAVGTPAAASIVCWNSHAWVGPLRLSLADAADRRLLLAAWSRLLRQRWTSAQTLFRTARFTRKDVAATIAASLVTALHSFVSDWKWDKSRALARAAKDAVSAGALSAALSDYCLSSAAEQVCGYFAESITRWSKHLLSVAVKSAVVSRLLRLDTAYYDLAPSLDAGEQQTTDAGCSSGVAPRRPTLDDEVAQLESSLQVFVQLGALVSRVGIVVWEVAKGTPQGELLKRLLLVWPGVTAVALAIEAADAALRRSALDAGDAEDAELSQVVDQADIQSLSARITLVRLCGAEEEERLGILNQENRQERRRSGFQPLSARLFDVVRYGVVLILEWRMTTVAVAAGIATQAEAHPLAEAAIHCMSAVQFAAKSFLHTGDCAGAPNVVRILAASPTIDTAPGTSVHPSAWDIDVDAVSFAYPVRPHRPVLAGCSLRVPAGSCVGIAGASGSGKSSLCLLLARLYDPTAGSISVGGIPITELPCRFLRSRVVVVPQECPLVAGSVLDNVLYGNSAGKADDLLSGGAGQPDVEAALKAAQAYDFVSQLPEGVRTVVSGPRAEAALSGGQRQRLAIARALLKQPRVLVLDESTSACDGLTEERLLTAVRGWLGRSGASLVITAHRVSALRHSDRVVCMKEGCVAEEGTHDSLKLSGGEYSRLVASQLM
eukprot:TRINITY_DN39971_c0_g1_i1.p1 TRINITY_DN39971_c0_g1~~TRINITY_DN39971_c0_g1_i1.p1  ORF type:complete len:798 (+),score=222.53 TRINITY_DN39971_c0_g1_i1:28-2394(+)